MTYIDGYFAPAEYQTNRVDSADIFQVKVILTPR